MSVEQQNLLNAYYEEADTKARRSLLLQYTAAAQQTEIDRFRQTLFETRYRGSDEIDKFLWYYINLLCVYKNSNTRFFKKSAHKELCSIATEMGLYKAQELGEDGVTEMYRECYNAAKRFITVCAGDKSYQKKLVGLVTINEDELKDKLAKDVYTIANGLPENFAEEKELLSPLTRATHDAFAALYPETAAHWAESETR